MTSKEELENQREAWIEITRIVLGHVLKEVGERILAEYGVDVEGAEESATFSSPSFEDLARGDDERQASREEGA
jgi:hypothetical protein